MLPTLIHARERAQIEMYSAALQWYLAVTDRLCPCLAELRLELSQDLRIFETCSVSTRVAIYY